MANQTPDISRTNVARVLRVAHKYLLGIANDDGSQNEEAYHNAVAAGRIADALDAQQTRAARIRELEAERDSHNAHIPEQEEFNGPWEKVMGADAEELADLKALDALPSVTWEERVRTFEHVMYGVRLAPSNQRHCKIGIALAAAFPEDAP